MSKDSRPQPHKRGQWANKREFLLTVAGQIIGLSNVWRFPYLCFKNGGGVFLIPYVVFLSTCGIPLFFAETSLGQFSREGGITCWKNICLLAKGLGYGSQVAIFYYSVYYIVIPAWACLTSSPPSTPNSPGAAVTTPETQMAVLIMARIILVIPLEMQHPWSKNFGNFKIQHK